MRFLMLSPNFRPTLIASLLALFLAGSQTASHAQNAPLKINRVEDVIENWSEEQHLYVKGELGVTQEQFEKLEAWLDKKAPNWTVILMQNAGSEYYSADDGRKFADMEAVRFALGHRLNNRTDFGAQADVRTGEANGAVFVLFLQERKFSFYGSDVHDRRKLGEAQWRGRLDREAVRAMRNGGRIIDAVKNTISYIDNSLSRKIEAEEAAVQRVKDAKKRAQQERERAIAELRSRTKIIQTTTLDKIKELARKLKTQYPRAKDSKLATPPIEAWGVKLESLQNSLNQPDLDLRKSRSASAEIERELNHFLDAYAAHAAFEEMLAPVESRLDEIADEPSGAAGEISREAYRLLDEARDGHALGELDFASPVHQAGELVKQGKQAILDHRRVAQKEAEQKKLIRKTILTVASVIGVFFLGLLWVLNIRRRPALRRAHALFEKRTQSVTNELEKVDEMILQSEKIIGTDSSFKAKKYTGRTQLLGNQTHQQIESLRQLATEARRVIDYAGILLHPANPIAEAANMFSGARYEHCVNELNGSSLQIDGPFDSSKQKGGLIWVTFGEFFSKLHQLKLSAESNLNLFQRGVESVDEQVDLLQSKISEANQLEQEISRAARLDRNFRIPALFADLIPSAQDDCDQAESIANSDPLKAMNEEIPDGLRKIEDGLTIARAIKTARDEVFPNLDQTGKQLKKLGFKVRWIQELVSQLSARADHLLSLAARQSVQTQALAFADDLSAIGQRSVRTLELATQINNEIAPSLAKLKKRIADGREEIGRSLGIPFSTAMTEDQYNPDEDWRQANQQLDSARAAINFGGVESAMESLQEFAVETGQVTHLVETSLLVLKEFETDHEQQCHVLETLNQETLDYENLIQTIKNRFANSAMILRDDQFIEDYQSFIDDPSPTIQSVFSNCSGALKGAANGIKTARNLYTRGEVLSAANTLGLIKNDLASVKVMFNEIASHCKSVDKLMADNQSLLDQRLDRLASMLDEISDDRTQPATSQHHRSLDQKLKTFKLEFDAPGVQRDPFSDAQQIQNFETVIDELAGDLQADRHAFEASTLAVGAAENELHVAQRLVAKSLNDRITDSVTVKSCQTEISNFDSELANIRKRLKVPHEDWSTVNLAATELNNKLGIVGGKLRHELELAQRAAELLAKASKDVYEAANWRGKYGIVVVARPGADELRDARNLLAKGNYHRSAQFSRAASQRSAAAIAAANRQVARKRRKIAREAEERRRRQNSTSMLTFGNSSFGSSSKNQSSWSSGNTTWGSSSSSSSSPSSSSRSSSSSGGGGSGFGTSGW